MSTSDAPPPPAGWPVYDVTFVDAVKRGFRQYVAFDGRAGRAEFWYWYLFVVGTEIALIAPTIAIGSASLNASGSGSAGIGPVSTVGLVIFGLFYAAVLLPTLAIICRRLHDAGFSGLFLLLALVTGLIPLIMCMLPTSPNAVRYGPPGQPEQPAPYGSPSGAHLPPTGYGPPQGYGAQPAPQAYGQPHSQQPYPQQPYSQQPYSQQPYPDQPYSQQPDGPQRD